MAQHNDVGMMGESLIYGVLASTGAPVEIGGAADLRLGGVDIEVKTARPSRYNGMGALDTSFA